jgi:hypothetical protein
MSRELKIISWEKVKWQEAFPLLRGRFICPYCGEEVKPGKAWGLCLTKEEMKLPKKDMPGLVVVTCPECRIPFLKPKRIKKEEPEIIPDTAMSRAFQRAT